MPNYTSLFKGYTIVSCGTLRGELNYLKHIHFLDADRTSRDISRKIQKPSFRVYQRK